MKRLICFALTAAVLLSFGGSALGEIVGYVSDYEYIHRYLAPNGQELFFVSMEEEPPIVFEDVNGDGMEDIVVYTAIGAANFYSEFFVWDGEKYVMALHAEDLINFSLQPGGLVFSCANNGLAGALFDYALYAWSGTDLRLVRKMTSENDETWTFTDTGYTVTSLNDVLHVRRWDYAQGENEYENTLTWETRFTLTDMERSAFDLIEEKLWEGLERE